MYKIKLADGTIIDNLERVNYTTFEQKGNDSSPIYFQLSDQNLSFAILYKDDEVEEIFIKYRRQNFLSQNNLIRFRIAPIQELEEIEERKRIREEKRKKKKG